MYCPICDQKPINCICTEVERQQFSDIEDLEEEIARLRLSDAEREAVGNAAAAMQAAADELGLSQADCERMVATLRGLLARHCPVPENAAE